MPERSLPAHLAEIVEPLREADEYTRLQHIRQRGFYNLVTGLPMFLFLLPAFVPIVFIKRAYSCFVAARSSSTRTVRAAASS